MQYISFYKNRLPFKPRSNMVIYFDVTGIGQKIYYSLLNDFYDEIVNEFQLGGLEFCYLPKIAADMDLRKIYRYFNPEAGNGDCPIIRLYRDSDLLEYIVADFDSRSLEPGLIQYLGEDFDKEDTYTFAFTPIPREFSISPIELIRQYVRTHGVQEAFFYSDKKINCRLDGHGFADDACKITKSCSNTSSLPKQYGSVNEETDIEMVMSEVQALVERLRQSGVGEVALQRLFKPTQKLSRIHVRYGRIFLPDYNNMEIRMLPLSKAIYLLYLHHPEGIKFSYLPDHREELQKLYELISGRDNREDVIRSINDVTDPTRNSINEKCSRIKQAFLREFDDSIARNYYITGERGEAKKILLPKEMIIWEMPR